MYIKLVSLRMLPGVFYRNQVVVTFARTFTKQIPKIKGAADDVSNNTSTNIIKQVDDMNVKVVEQDNSEQSNIQMVEINGFNGPEPTRYGDFERSGRCYDF
uniref:Succinate dehydrogenase assembly factor 4, mitochondrial n=1 Tax=Lygus hesperus TaxID=30085 RepID=A0A0A9Y323_LYGHE